MTRSILQILGIIVDKMARIKGRNIEKGWLKDESGLSSHTEAEITGRQHLKK